MEGEALFEYRRAWIWRRFMIGEDDDEDGR